MKCPFCDLYDVAEPSREETVLEHVMMHHAPAGYCFCGRQMLYGGIAWYSANDIYLFRRHCNNHGGFMNHCMDYLMGVKE